MLSNPCADILKSKGQGVSRAQLEGEVQDMNEVMIYQKKTGCSSSKGEIPLKKRGRTSKKMLLFIANPRRKPVKKQIGFRRRTGRPSKSYSVDGLRVSKRVSIAKSLSRKKKKRKKKCNVMAQAASQQPSVPSITDGLAPKYHLSYKQVLQAYKKLRKGRGFRASRKVLWKNRHTLVFGSKNLYKFGRFESYRMREKEYDITEPPDEEEDPQLLETGPRYSSDEAADGPFLGDKTKVKEPDMNTLPLTVLGMGPEFSSDPAGDGPVYSSSDTESCDGSESSYDPVEEKARRKKKRRAKLNVRRRKGVKRTEREKELKKQSTLNHIQ